MILLTRLNGETVALNVDRIERAEANPDTVITMVDGVKYVVAESLDELIEKVASFRATVLAMASGDEVSEEKPVHLHLVKSAVGSDTVHHTDSGSTELTNSVSHESELGSGRMFRSRRSRPGPK